jgi:Apea-like HEPN
VHTEAVKTCRSLIRTALAGMRIAAGATFPIPSETVWRPLSKFSQIILKDKVLSKWVRSSEAAHIPYASVGRVLRSRMQSPAASEGALRDFIGDDGLQAIEELIIQTLESIPRQYVGYFRLPISDGALGMASGDLGPGIRLIDANSVEGVPDFLRRPEEPQNRASALADLFSVAAKSVGSALQSAVPMPPKIYLEVAGHGFCSGSLSSPTVQFMIARMKQVVVLGETVQGFMASSYFDSGNDSLSALQVYGVDADELTRIALPESMARYLSSVGFRSERWIDNNPRPQRIVSVLGGPLSREEAFAGVFAEVTRSIAADSRDVLTAAEWTFDAAAESNETLSYLYTAIGLEAALGSSDKRVVESLSDRLSYLVGRTRSERLEIQEKFSEFYRHRSKIVHGRVAELGETESELLRWGRTMLYRAIARELTLQDRQ